MKTKKIVTLSIILTLFTAIFPIIAGIIIETKNINDIFTRFLILALSFLLGIIITLLIIFKSRFFFKDIGFNKYKIEKWMIYIIFFEIIGILNGVQKKMLNPNFIIVLILFVIIAGTFEELIFRGLIFNYLSEINIKFAIIISSFLFGIIHLSNLLSGSDLLSTIIQVLYAFLFGFISATIVAKTKSIYFVIFFHALHNFINLITIVDLTNSFSQGIFLAQSFALTLLSIYLWRDIFYKKIKD